MTRTDQTVGSPMRSGRTRARRGRVGDVVAEGVLAPASGLVVDLGSDHVGCDFASIAAGGLGVVGDGMDREVLPSLGCLFPGRQVFANSRRTKPADSIALLFAISAFRSAFCFSGPDCACRPLS